LYGRETWPPTLREEHRLNGFENGALRRIFGPKRDEIIEGGVVLHASNEVLHNLFSLPTIITVIKSRRMQ
jgi:hypothetical protein